MEKLRDNKEIAFVELNATLVNDEAAFAKEVERCRALEEEYISSGKSVGVYTTRALITADTGDKEDDLRLSVRISDAVQSLVGRLTVTPSFVIAKGGITSSDVGTKALAVTRANVLGQICPGIPVWQTGAETTAVRHNRGCFPAVSGTETKCKNFAERSTGLLLPAEHPQDFGQDKAARALLPAAVCANRHSLPQKLSGRTGRGLFPPAEKPTTSSSSSCNAPNRLQDLFQQGPRRRQYKTPTCQPNTPP